MIQPYLWDHPESRLLCQFPWRPPKGLMCENVSVTSQLEGSCFLQKALQAT